MDTSISNLTSDGGLSDLLDETKTSDGLHPVDNVGRLNLNDGHARVLGLAGVDAITKVTEPSGNLGGVELLHEVGCVGDLGGVTSNADPVLGAGVLEGDLALLGVLEVGELLGVGVGEVEEVGAVTAGDGHGTRHGADILAESGEKTDLQLVDNVVEVLDLLFLVGLVVVLLGDGGVGLGVDLGGFELLRHFEG